MHYLLWDQGAAFSITKTEEMVVDGKDALSVRKPKGIPGSVGLIGGKSGQIRKAALGSGCDATSQRFANKNYIYRKQTLMGF